MSLAGPPARLRTRPRVGDGRPLLAMTVAVRTTRTGTPRGVDGRLQWEVKRVVEALDEPTAAEVERDLLVGVEGASSSARSTVRGARDGVAVRETLVVGTDGDHLHVVRVGVLDDEDGRETVRRVLSGLRIRPWSRPR